MTNGLIPFELRANKEKEDYYLRKLDGTQLAVLDYKNWYSSEARLTIGEWLLQAGSDNLWNTSYSVKDLESGETVAKITFNWKLEAILTVTLPPQESTVFVLKATGFWNYRFTLFQNDELVMTISPDFRLKKMSYEYKIEGKPFFESETDTYLLTLVSVYISNLLMTMISTVAIN